MGRIDGVLNTIDQPLYDSVRLAAAAVSRVTFFAVPQGQPGTAFAAAGNKTLADTNLTNAGILPAPQRFTVKALAFRVGASVTVGDLKLIMDSSVFELTVGSKVFLQCPASYLTAGMGLWASGAGAAVGLDTVLQNGIADPRALRVLDQPIMIDQQQNFSVTLSWPVAAVTIVAATPVQLFMLGTLYRAVQ